MPHAQLPVRASLTRAMRLTCELLAGSGGLKSPDHGDWLVRESVLGFCDFRWDVSTTHPLPKFIKHAYPVFTHEL